MQFTTVGLRKILKLADENDVVKHAALQEPGREFHGCPDISDDKSVDVEHGKVVEVLQCRNGACGPGNC